MCTGNLETMSILPTNKLFGSWNVYYHLPHDKSWEVSSYKIIMNNISTVEHIISLNEHFPENVIKYCMLFVMREGIAPTWEDKLNRNGGCFSFKILNKNVQSVWKSLLYSLCGETLTVNRAHSQNINGVTISPKKNFCIIKVWLRDCSLQDPNILITLPNMLKQGCLFKKHEPEF